MKRRLFLSAIPFLSLSDLCLANSPDTELASVSWQEASPLPSKIQELYPAVHNQQLFVAGGIAPKKGKLDFTDKCYRFDPVKNAWAQAPNLPETRHHAALVSSSEELYMVGGFHGTTDHAWRMRGSVHKLYDDGWQAVGDLPRPQAEGVLATAPDNAVHLVTGQSPKGEANKSRSDHIEVTDHWRWESQTDHWEKAAPIPTPRNSATGGWLGDQLIVSGGRTANGNLATTEIYDSKEDRWRQAAPMPLPQAGTASAVIDDGIIVFGGEIFVPQADVFANVWYYQFSSDKWFALPDMPTPRHGIGAGRISNKIYVIGGATQPSGRGTSNKNEVLVLS